MFSKVLVANRGEIAVRIIQTLRAMGIAPVAVYSGPDAGAPHVTMAEQSVALPGNTADETYLNIISIVQAARDCGADAIHPGYGFLSENPQFARACREAQITFIGPSPRNMEALGDKLRSKEIALSAGVPVVPSSPECLPGDDAAGQFAERWGLPLLVKAAAGGGGRGMRLVNNRRELAGGMEAARPGGPGRLRGWPGVPRALHCQPPPRGGAGAGRRLRAYHPPGRAGMQRTASPPEDSRGKLLPRS